MKAAARAPVRRPSRAVAAAPHRAGELAVATHVRVLQHFRIVFNAVKTHFQQVERKAGLGGAQVWALSVVSDRPGIGINELAAALNVRQPTASIIAKNLARQGFVEARRDQLDRRGVRLHATAEGGRLLRRVPGPYAGVLPSALQALNPATLDLLDAGLTELIALLGVDDSAATVPLAGIRPATE